MSEEVLDAETADNLTADDSSMDTLRTFDELEQATMNKTPEQLVRAAKKDVAEKSKAEIELSNAEHENQAKTNAKTTKNASEKQPQEAADELSEELEDEMIEELKLLKAVRGEKEYEIPEDGMLKVKIDGEEVDVTLADLRNNYSGKTAWDKKFTELDKERKEYLEDRGIVERYVNEFRQIAQSDNKAAALEFFSQISGQNPLEFRRELKAQLREEILREEGLSEPEREALQLREENEFLIRQQESESQRASESQSRREAEAQVRELQETHDLTDDDIAKLYDQVLNGSNQPLSDAQVLSEMNTLALKSRASSGAEYLLGKVNNELVSESNVEAVTDLIMENPEFTEQDFIDVISEAMGSQPAKKVSKKAKAAAKKASPKQQQSSTQSDLLSFDDLEN